MLRRTSARIRNVKQQAAAKTDDPDPTPPLNPVFQRPHPLLIPHITNEIFGYLSLAKIKNCRSVCQAWENVGTMFLKKKAVVVFDSEERIAEFLDFYPNITLPKFTNYKFTQSVDPLSPNLGLFLNRFGSTNVRYAHFDKVNFVAKKQPLHYMIFSQIQQVEELVLDLRDCPLGKTSLKVFYRFENLKSVTCTANFETDSHLEGFDNTLMWLFYCSPNIEKVSTILKTDKTKMRNYPYQDYMLNTHNIQILSPTRLENNSVMTDLSIASAIASIPAPASPSKLTHFDIPLVAMLPLLNCMIKRNFQLKTLNICIVSPSSDELTMAMTKFFAQISGCLKTLRVTFGRTEASTVGIPVLQSLRNLDLYGCKYPEHFNIINRCPSLETLLLVQCNLPKNFHDTARPYLVNLKTFIEHDVTVQAARFPATVLATSICNDFPHLKKLKLDKLNDHALSLICTNLQFLEELFLLDSKITDSGVTGISKPTLKTVSKSMTKAYATKYKGKRKPYIGNLQRLRTLQIGSNTLTDISICYGILDCETVRSLTIFSPKFTGKGLRNIVDAMDLLDLRTVCCYAINDSTLEYARKKLKDPERVILNSEKGPKTALEVNRIIHSYGLAHLEPGRIYRS